jgi:regulation of enolase protein 1 (concanavalin A-like superfamily)
MLISDDFNTAELSPIWTFVNPLGDSSASVGGVGTGTAQLTIDVPGVTWHDAWDDNDAPRVMQSVDDSDFEVEVKFETVLTQQFQIMGLIVEQDTQRWLRFDFFNNGSDTVVFAGTTTGGNSSIRIGPVVVESPGANLWLKVNRSGNIWTMSYSTDGSDWTEAGAFTSTMVVESVGVFAGNRGPLEGDDSPAITAVVDYVFDTASPIVPEDGP